MLVWGNVDKKGPFLCSDRIIRTYLEEGKPSWKQPSQDQQDSFFDLLW